MLDLGRNNFAFGIFSHEGGFANGTQRQSEIFQKPLIAYQTSSRREGDLESGYSFLKINNENAILRCRKLAEDGDGIIVRVNEGAARHLKMLSSPLPQEYSKQANALQTSRQSKRLIQRAKSLNSTLRPTASKHFA